MDGGLRVPKWTGELAMVELTDNQLSHSCTWFTRPFILMDFDPYVRSISAAWASGSSLLLWHSLYHSTSVMKYGVVRLTIWERGQKVEQSGCVRTSGPRSGSSGLWEKTVEYNYNGKGKVVTNTVYVPTFHF